MWIEFWQLVKLDISWSGFILYNNEMSIQWVGKVLRRRRIMQASTAGVEWYRRRVA